MASQFGLVALAVAVMLRPWATWPMRVVAMHRGAGVPFREQRTSVVVVLTGTVLGVATHLVSVQVVATPTLATEAAAVAAFGVLYAAAMLLLQRPLLGRVRGDLAGVLPGRRRAATPAPDPAP